MPDFGRVGKEATPEAEGFAPVGSNSRFGLKSYLFLGKKVREREREKQREREREEGGAEKQ